MTTLLAPVFVLPFVNKNAECGAGADTESGGSRALTKDSYELALLLSDAASAPMTYSLEMSRMTEIE